MLVELSLVTAAVVVPVLINITALWRVYISMCVWRGRPLLTAYL